MTDAVIVPLASLAVAPAPARLSAVGLGSCVAVTLWDPEARIGGLAHVLLPAPPQGSAADLAARYAASAVPSLVEQLVARGAGPSRLLATLSGGAAMFAALQPPGSLQVGERNTVAAREALRAAGIPVRAEWVGGDFGRSTTLDVGSGIVTVSSVRHGSRQL